MIYRLKNILNKFDAIAESSYLFSNINILINIFFDFKNFFIRKKLKFKLHDKIKLNKLNLDGYYLSTINDNELLNNLEDISKNTKFIKSESKQYLQRIEINPLLNPIVKKFILSEDIIYNVSEYFGFIPILNQCSVWITDEGNDQDIKSSQNFHLDHDDKKQIKIFINLIKIDKNSGPFKFYNKKDSKVIYKKIKKIFEFKNFKINFLSRNQKQDDKTLFSIINEKYLITNEGNKGDLLCVDTSQCYHMGGRTKDKKRILFHLNFISPFTYKSNNLEFKNMLKKADKLKISLIEKLIFLRFI